MHIGLTGQARFLRLVLVGSWLGVALAFARLTEPYRPVSDRLEWLAVAGAIVGLFAAVAVARGPDRLVLLPSASIAVAILAIALVLILHNRAHETGVLLSVLAAGAAGVSIIEYRLFVRPQNPRAR